MTDLKRSAAPGHPLQESFLDASALRAYLLGHSSADAADRLEERLLEDDEVFTALSTAEDDLFDEYARGRLRGDDRVRFLERYGTRTARLRFADALVQRAPRDNVVPFARRYWVPLAAAAALVIIAGGLFRTRVEAPSVLTVQPPASGQTAPPAVLALALGTSRAAAPAAAFVLPKNVPALQLRVRLDPADRFDVYAMELRTASGSVSWRDSNLRAAIEGADLVLVGHVPVASLPADGSYELAVRGGKAAGTLDDLGFVTFTIRWSP